MQSGVAVQPKNGQVPLGEALHKARTRVVDEFAHVPETERTLRKCQVGIQRRSYKFILTN